MTRPLRAPQVILVDDDAERALKLRAMTSSYHPVAVRWGAQVAPLVRLVDPQMLIVAAPRKCGDAAMIVRGIRDDGYTKPVLALVADSHDQHARTMRSAGATIVECSALHAIVAAHFQGARARPDDHLLHFEDAVVDLARGEVVRGGERSLLSPRERALLGALHRRAGEVVTRETLVADVWGDTAIASRVVDRHIMALRRRIERDPRRPRHIIAVFARGYRLDVVR